jgi:hypothetical protein
MDGKVLQEILSPDFVPPPLAEDDFDGLVGDLSGEGLSEEDKAIVTERLRNLGYVG